MKKTLIALFALAGVAAADSITLDPGSTVTGVTGGTINDNRPFVSETDYTTADLKSIIDQISDPTVSGWYTGVGQGQNYVSDVTLTTTGFNFKARSGVSHEYVLGIVAAPTNTKALTMQFTSDVNVSASIWTYDKTTEEITMLVGRTTATANTPFETTVSNLELGTNDMVVFAWSSSATGGASSGADVKVTDVELTATTSSAAVPEPTTATLSLLALAGLAARRRRR